jgi:hypothetical protein
MALNAVTSDAASITNEIEQLEAQLEDARARLKLSQLSAKDGHPTATTILKREYQSFINDEHNLTN